MRRVYTCHSTADCEIASSTLDLNNVVLIPISIPVPLSLHFPGRIEGMIAHLSHLALPSALLHSILLR
jgi:hypothetical protein